MVKMDQSGEVEDLQLGSEDECEKETVSLSLSKVCSMYYLEGSVRTYKWGNRGQDDQSEKEVESLSLSKVCPMYFLEDSVRIYKWSL